MDELQQTLEQYDIEIDPAQLPLLDKYRELLWEWNERMNLTRHTTMEKFVVRDVMDSVKLAELLPKRNRVLDIGTGGGVPGVVMAIIRPDLRVSVCESMAKKAKAVEGIVDGLDGLKVHTHHARAEDILAMKTFDTLVARAVAPLPKMLRWFEPHWDAFDQLLVIKGKNWPAERGEARHIGLLKGLSLRRAQVYNTPGTEIESVVLRISRDEE